MAVDDLSFAVEAGRVTGFLGPNGAGKTTTMRALLGLLRPSSGEALVEGSRRWRWREPLRTIGAALEATAFHPGRSGRNHLRRPRRRGADPALAGRGGAGDGRADGAAKRRVKGYSLGMRQRLALAAALLGEPRILILDEPANGLDPQGMRWLRDLLRAQAAEGRTVLVSSHLLSEVAQTADELVVIRNGKLVAADHAGRVHRRRPAAVRVRAADLERARRRRWRARRRTVERDGDGALLVAGLERRGDRRAGAAARGSRSTNWRRSARAWRSASSR